LARIVPLSEEHLEDAAALLSSRYITLCEQEPLLPHRYRDVSSLLPHLQNIIQAAGPGVVAVQDGRLVGFLKGWLMPTFRGKRSVYSPEWANAADLKDSQHIYEDMYRHLAADWVADEFVAHYISIFANDLNAIRAWHWLGFGMTAVDAIRGLQSITDVKIQIDIQRASLQHLEQIVELHDGLRQHAKGSPDFFVAEKLSRKYFEEWLGNPGAVIWLACVNEDPVAFLRMGPANDDVCTIIHDEKTTSIYDVFTKETVRGKDIATALLGRAIESARSMGSERIAVDFEPMNLLATRFWLRHHFKPVCFSLLRYVDERVVRGKRSNLENRY
jgi:GNAT superfamily N-acetyltransferase